MYLSTGKMFSLGMGYSCSACLCGVTSLCEEEYDTQGCKLDIPRYGQSQHSSTPAPPITCSSWHFPTGSTRFTEQSPVTSPHRSGASDSGALSPRGPGDSSPQGGPEEPPDGGPGTRHHPHTTTAITLLSGPLRKLRS